VAVVEPQPPTCRVLRKLHRLRQQQQQQQGKENKIETILISRVDRKCTEGNPASKQEEYAAESCLPDFEVIFFFPVQLHFS